MKLVGNLILVLVIFSPLLVVYCLFCFNLGQRETEHSAQSLARFFKLRRAFTCF